MKKIFKHKLSVLADFIANPYTFFCVLLLGVIWTAYGYFSTHFSITWVTYTDAILGIATFLIVFIVQFSEETETEAIQKKLDEIIKAFPQVDQEALGIEKDMKQE
jgi:low affinity Fe/Cu permease